MPITPELAVNQDDAIGAATADGAGDSHSGVEVRTPPIDAFDCVTLIAADWQPTEHTCGISTDLATGRRGSRVFALTASTSQTLLDAWGLVSGTPSEER